MIQAESLSKCYGPVQALENVSLSAERGDIVGVLGPNGAGKSTLMRILTGIMPPSEGCVSVAGHDLFEQPIKARRQIGFLPELPPVYRDQTIEEYLRYCGRLRSLKGRQLLSAVDNVILKCQLEKMRKRLIGNLSKGFQQRVGIAQAIIHDPQVLVLDEPTVGLDPNQIIEIRNLVRSLGQERVVILSTHILQEVEAVCTRVVMLNQGCIVFSGEMEAFTGEDSGNWRVTFNKAPEISAIEDILPDSRVILGEGKGEFVISCLDDLGTRAAFIEKTVSIGWQPVRVSPDMPQLEQVFIEHTCFEEKVNE